MLKIAIDAGHCLKTAGKRIPKALDPNQTREWVLNDRVARYQEEAAKLYEGVETMRVDDVTGKTEVSLATRCKRANNWGADLYCSHHHNAGIKQGSGGGIVAYCYKVATEDAEYRDMIYEACIAAGGLRGNRSNPTPEKGFHVLKYTKMPAVLMEYGFMDSTTDAPIILTEDYAKRMGYAVMEAIAKKHNLRKRSVEPTPEKPAVEALEEDGKWGSATTTRLQQIFGTTVDGEVSNQLAKYQSSNPGLTTGWEWEKNPNGKGSQLIRAMQKWAGMPEDEWDGLVGPKTFRAIQAKLGTTVDGYVSKPSQMVKALQRWANSQEVA